jgi:Domain of unknown function (DUF4164)
LRIGDDGGEREAMSDSAIEEAARRLTAALDGLEAALERRREADRSEAALAAQVSALGADRSRLAAELDRETARAHRLDSVSREVSRRLEAAMEAIRGVVAAQDR